MGAEQQLTNVSTKQTMNFSKDQFQKISGCLKNQIEKETAFVRRKVGIIHQPIRCFAAFESYSLNL